MQFLQRCWDEIKRGENFDLYLTAIVSLVLVLLNLLGIGQAWTAPLTLAVLTLIAISLLGNRHQNADLAARFSQTAETLFVDEFPPSLKSDFASAKELWLVGIALTTPINAYYSVMEEKLRKGHNIKVLMLQPESPAVEMSETRAYVKGNVERANGEIHNSLQDFCELQKIAPSQMEIRTIPFLLGHGVVATDPDIPQGALYISNYPFKTKGGSLPRFVLRPKDGRWYELYRQELKNLWESSEEWNGRMDQDMS